MSDILSEEIVFDQTSNFKPHLFIWEDYNNMYPITMVKKYIFNYGNSTLGLSKSEYYSIILDNESTIDLFENIIKFDQTENIVITDTERILIVDKFYPAEIVKDDIESVAYEIKGIHIMEKKYNDILNPFYKETIIKNTRDEKLNNLLNGKKEKRK